jgi:16S rRNA (guanine966-N2)-methyltransferase
VNPRSKVRIIAGEYRGRRIPVAQKADLRPTPDRVRETLFNWLGQWLDGLACLDLFAGSGALGFEAASRGAARVVMVESDVAVFQSLEKFRELVDARTIELVRGDAFEVVFLDPPFRQNALPAVFRQLQGAPGTRVYVEAREPFAPGGPWHELKRSRAGQVSYQLFEWRSDDQGGLPRDV